MAGLNRVVLVGRIVRKPEAKALASGMAVTSFTVAIDNPVGKSNADSKGSTSFIPCTCWNKTAENVAKYCDKGSLVGIDGRLNQRNWEDKNGGKHSVVEVIAENVQFLERKDSKSTDTNNSDESDGQPDTNTQTVHEGIDSDTLGDLPF